MIGKLKRAFYVAYGWMAWKATRRYTRRRTRKALQLLRP
jgi:hypothetical protein